MQFKLIGIKMREKKNCKKKVEEMIKLICTKNIAMIKILEYEIDNYASII